MFGVKAGSVEDGSAKWFQQAGSRFSVSAKIITNIERFDAVVLGLNPRIGRYRFSFL
jgi:hypothetical protein